MSVDYEGFAGEPSWLFPGYRSSCSLKYLCKDVS